MRADRSGSPARSRPRTTWSSESRTRSACASAEAALFVTSSSSSRAIMRSRRDIAATTASVISGSFSIAFIAAPSRLFSVLGAAGM